MKKINLGIIGAGIHFNKNILPVLNKFDNLNLETLIINKNKKNIENIFDKKIFLNLDLVYISTPNMLHEKFIIESLKNDIHVICEKPFLTSSKNFKKIKNLSKKKNLLIFEAFMYKYHSLFNFIKDEIILNKKKKIKYILSNFRFPSLDKQNNRYNPNLGNGFFFDCACYLLSIENFFFNRKTIYQKTNFQYIKENVPLRGNIFLKSKNISRYYFWGEGQRYSNNIEIFYDKGSIYVPYFFSKPKNKEIILEINENFKNKKKVFKYENHFSNMFNIIFKSYKNKNFQKNQINLIENQIKLLEKILKLVKNEDISIKKI